MKKTFVSLALLAIATLFVAVFVFDAFRNRATPSVNDDLAATSTKVTEQIEQPNDSSSTTPISIGCPKGLTQSALMGTDGSKQIICTPASALQQYSIGDGTQSYELYGYYSPYIQKIFTIDYDPSSDQAVATTTCTAFTVLGGDADLIRVFREAVILGNTVNHIDDKGNLVLNIDLEKVATLKRDNITRSTLGKPVLLSVKLLPNRYTEARICESFINII